MSQESMCLALLAEGEYWILLSVDNHRMHPLPPGRELIEKNNLGIGNVKEPVVGECFLTVVGVSGLDGAKTSKEIRYLS